MSLLLEALKKAEKAKEEAQRRAREGDDAGAGAAAPAPAEQKPVVTRDKLPDISPTLEIVSDDLAPRARAEPPAPELAIEPPAPPKPAARAERSETASRAAAKKVFEAKFREPNPRMPFYITIGVLAVFAIGTVIYFWYQLRPPPALVNLNPVRQAEKATVAEAPPATAAAPASPAPANTIPGLPSTTPAAPPPPVASAPVPRKPQASRPPSPPTETPRLAPRLATAAAPGPVTPPPSQPTSTRPPPQVQPNVAAGYDAYISGDLATARTQYAQALGQEPANRDALLGLAAVEVRLGRFETAEALYLRALQADPRDAIAQAALISLRAGRNDPLASESRVKSLLAIEPGAHALNFALGNQLAQQNRWAEAQQEYFKAYTAEPDNADFAYNLAVSLDHLRQPRQALEYYQRAIGLAEKRGAGFDLQAARLRASELGK